MRCYAHILKRGYGEKDWALGRVDEGPTGCSLLVWLLQLWVTSWKLKFWLKSWGNVGWAGRACWSILFTQEWWCGVLLDYKIQAPMLQLGEYALQVALGSPKGMSETAPTPSFSTKTRCPLRTKQEKTCGKGFFFGLKASDNKTS